MKKKPLALLGIGVLLIGVIILCFDKYDQALVSYFFVTPESPKILKAEQQAKVIRETRRIERYVKRIVDCEATFAPYFKKSIVGGLVKPIPVVLRDGNGVSLDKKRGLRGWQLEAEYSPASDLTVGFAKQSDLGAMRRLKEVGQRRRSQTDASVPFGRTRLCEAYLQANEAAFLKAIVKEADASKNWQMHVDPRAFNGPFPLKIQVRIVGNGTLHIPSLCHPVRIFSTSSPLLEVRSDYFITGLKIGPKVADMGCSGLSEPHRVRVTANKPLTFNLTIDSKVAAGAMPARSRFFLKMHTKQEEGKYGYCLACPFGPYPAVRLESPVIVWSKRGAH